LKERQDYPLQPAIARHLARADRVPAPLGQASRSGAALRFHGRYSQPLPGITSRAYADMQHQPGRPRLGALVDIEV
jgi:hypothetical protein